jgi:hypothetical protein
MAYGFFVFSDNGDRTNDDGDEECDFDHVEADDTDDRISAGLLSFPFMLKVFRCFSFES